MDLLAQQEVTYLLMKRLITCGLGTLDFQHQDHGIQLVRLGDLFKALEEFMVIGIGMQL